MASPAYYGGFIYNDGSIYGALPAGILAAQLAQSRETGLQVSVTDENLNNWSLFAGAEPDFNIYKSDNNPTLQTYWSYRGYGSVVKLGNGNIVRVRLGDGTYGDRQIYIQTITDPTVASQWTSWSLLYSGDHYAINIVSDGTASGYYVYHAKSDGLYKNNVLKWSQTRLVSIKATPENPNQLYCVRVSEDPIDGAGKYRDLDAYFTNDIESVTPVADSENYRWYRNWISSIRGDLTGNQHYRFASNPRFADPRSRNTGDSISVAKAITTDATVAFLPDPAFLIRGLAGGQAHNTVSGPTVWGKLSDGYYYLFYAEFHSDPDYDSVVTPNISTIWQRSKDLYHWSEPVFTGFNSNIAGVIESGAYVYFCGWGVVWRRPVAAITYDISNYVPEVSMELPRANQPATAELIVANPAGINDALLNLISRPAAIKIGIKDQSTGNFSFREVSDWWVATAKRELDGNINRIKMTFGNIWERLKNPLRDTYNLIGQTIWEDWQIGARDKAFNYFFLSDSAPVENLDGSLSSKGVALYTGWKGHNCRFSVDFASLADASKSSVIIFRYIDSRNYYQVGVGSIGANGLILSRTVNGVTTTLATGTMPSVAARLQIDVRWRRYVISTDDVVRITHFETNPGSKPGYVGVGGVSWKISKLKLEDFEYPLTTEDLIRSALALGDYHTVSVGGATSRQMAITWGPQTDLTNAAEVLLRLFEEDKLEMIWREGRIEIGKFMSTSPIRTLQDQIIETDYIEEGYDRINLSMVDGNEHTWIEVDAVDTQDRDRQLNGYFDIPELLDQSAVTARAQEEIRRSKMGKSPGALIPFQFDLYRMDPVTLVDNNGVSNLVRIEGFEIEIQQNEKPTQHQRLDTSLLT